MLSLQTCIELIYVIDNLVEREIDRIFHVFNIYDLIRPSLIKISKEEKVNILLEQLKNTNLAGPFSESFQLDLLQYKIDQFYRYEENPKTPIIKVYSNEPQVKMEDRFSDLYKTLCNSLKRDGYIIKARSIKKLLPAEVVEAKSESELFKLLNKFKFSISQGHLKQATNNHSLGNWAGANSQFRTFVESILTEICKYILPKNSCNNMGTAIKLLSLTANPPFLRTDLNEVESNQCDKPFIEGLWKRLHPEGSHPGLSDEEDSTFRYHVSIVFAHYLLSRLEKY
jgi:hypothetical protein